LNGSLLVVGNLRKYFPLKGFFFKTEGYVRAVDDVSIQIGRGEVFGLVGESGCGKTTLGRCLLRLIEPDKGSVFYDGVDMMKLRKDQLKETRQRIQIVFQNPLSSLDPRMSVRNLVAEPLLAYKLTEHLDSKIVELLELVGLRREFLWRYPHELSGGQNQRIAIARAIALNPNFIVLDEPTSALDVSVQAQILNLLQELQERLHMSYLLISHDLSVVQHISNRLGVMYLGKIVEMGGSDEIWEKPLHPYTEALLSAVPIPDPDMKSQSKVLTGEVPSSINPPSGCRFRTRCPYVMYKCQREEPQMIYIDRQHQVACHLHD
jgi:oligopeptide/dipeptide ABC transporter ATP-binding protein